MATKEQTNAIDLINAPCLDENRPKKTRLLLLCPPPPPARPALSGSRYQQPVLQTTRHWGRGERQSRLSPTPEQLQLQQRNSDASSRCCCRFYDEGRCFCLQRRSGLKNRSFGHRSRRGQRRGGRNAPYYHMYYYCKNHHSRFYERSPRLFYPLPCCRDASGTVEKTGAPCCSPGQFFLSSASSSRRYPCADIDRREPYCCCCCYRFPLLRELFCASISRVRRGRLHEPRALDDQQPLCWACVSSGTINLFVRRRRDLTRCLCVCSFDDCFLRVGGCRDSPHRKFSCLHRYCFCCFCCFYCFYCCSFHPG